MFAYDIQDVVKRFPGKSEPVNNHITLQINQGEIFGILGDNGAGKTTLIRQMVNLLRSTSGTIHLLGQDIARHPLIVPMNVGYMPQDSLALNNLTVGEALFFTAHLRGMKRKEAQKECDDLLDLWQLRPLRDTYSSRISGGQRRLLRLAVATAGHAPILILDEPTNDLDPKRRKLVWNILRDLNNEHGTTIIFITHDAVEAEKVVQRVAILREGQLAALGKPSELKRDVDRTLRLEIFCASELLPDLPDHLTIHQLQPGRWLILLDWDDVAPVMNRLQNQQIDDIHLSSATLEDVYLHYATQHA